jgi:hypothetical protein
MRTTKKFKTAVFGLVAVGMLALSANAQAVTLDAGVFATGAGDAANPIVFTNIVAGPAVFLDTINFDLGSFTHFNMTSTVNNIVSFGAPIFENNGDTEFVATSPTHLSVFLPDLGLDRDYHLHPAGFNLGGGTYSLALWGSTAPVPVPAAVWLFGSGLAALVGFARRKMNAAA